MSDEELVRELRAASGRLSPAELFDMLSVLGPDRPTQLDTIRLFKMAFPRLSVGQLMEPSSLMVRGEDADRTAFNAMLGPHLGQ